MQVKIEADFLYSYSTIDGKYSLRDETKGALYIQTLCDLIEHEPHEEISLLLVDVNNAISKLKPTTTLTPTYENRLRKRFYLKKQNQAMAFTEKTEKSEILKQIKENNSFVKRDYYLQCLESNKINQLFTNSKFSIATSKNIKKQELLGSRVALKKSPTSPPPVPTIQHPMILSPRNRSSSYSREVHKEKQIPPKVMPRKSLAMSSAQDKTKVIYFVLFIFSKLNGTFFKSKII